MEAKEVTTVFALRSKTWNNLAHDAKNCQPGTAPLEACLLSKVKEALDFSSETFSYWILSGARRMAFKGFCWTMQPQRKNQTVLVKFIKTNYLATCYCFSCSKSLDNQNILCVLWSAQGNVKIVKEIWT